MQRISRISAHTMYRVQKFRVLKVYKPMEINRKGLRLRHLNLNPKPFWVRTLKAYGALKASKVVAL